MTKLHINDIKLDVTRATNLDNEEDEKEDDLLEEGIGPQNGPEATNSSENEKRDSQTQNNNTLIYPRGTTSRPKCVVKVLKRYGAV